MGELEFSRAEVENLAQKLDSPQLQLSGKEKALLLAIFSAASSRVRPVEEARPTLDDLRDDLLNAFIPDDAACDFIINAPTNISPNPPQYITP
jgi:hypothetical protein